MSDDKYQGDNHRGDGRSSPYGLSRLAPEVTLVDVAKEIQAADRAIGQATSGKLRLIAAQIRQLQAQAQELLHTAKRDLDLHRAACHFERVPGQIYHLYEKADGSLLWSILSPEDWGVPPHTFVASYRLEPDQSWTPVEQLEADPADDPLHSEALLRQLLLTEHE